LYKLFLGLISRLAVVAAIIGLGLYYVRLFEALLTLVAILQFELAYRQYWLSRVLSEPVLIVSSEQKYVEWSEGKVKVRLRVKNIGSRSAKFVGVDRVLCNNVPLPPELWRDEVKDQSIAFLEPSSEGILWIVVDERFYEEYINKRKCVIEVSYYTDYGKERAFSLALYSSDKLTMTIEIKYEAKKPPGFLLSIPAYISAVRTHIAQRRALRRLQK